MAEDIGILIVDDDASIRLILTELFQDAGFRVDSAESPFLAVQKLGQGRFDLVFSDINMPGMTGIDLLRGLRDAASELLVVIMTADASLDTAIEATRLGAQDYLRKPFANLASVLDVANRLARKVEENRTKQAVVGSLLAAAKGNTALAALAEKAERVLGVRVDPRETTPIPRSGQELTGDISDFPLQEILQLLGMMKKTGILRVNPPGGDKAAIALSRGTILAARYGAVLDLKAIFRLFHVTKGPFHFQPTPEPPTAERMSRPMEWIIMEGTRHVDELTALAKAKPPEELIVRYNGALDGDVPADPGDLAIAERIRKPKPVRVLVETSPEPDLEVYQALIRLRRANALELYRAATKTG